MRYSFIFIFILLVAGTHAQQRDTLSTTTIDTLISGKRWEHNGSDEHHGPSRLLINLKNNRLSVMHNKTGLFIIECKYTVEVQNNFFRISTDSTCHINARETGPLYLYGYIVSRRPFVLITKEKIPMAESILDRGPWITLTPLEEQD